MVRAMRRRRQVAFGPGSRWLCILFYLGLTWRPVKELVSADRDSCLHFIAHSAPCSLTSVPKLH